MKVHVRDIAHSSLIKKKQSFIVSAEECITLKYASNFLYHTCLWKKITSCLSSVLISQLSFELAGTEFPFVVYFYGRAGLLTPLSTQASNSSPIDFRLSSGSRLTVPQPSRQVLSTFGLTQTQISQFKYWCFFSHSLVKSSSIREKLTVANILC